ncbi:NAD(P)H-binding protein [Ornithinibacillus halophilus]|uniref:Nucleoside-diphosphate-sugar epimerase n=1 Tax=Ornithinibacillus halophilus TaxID=930117 RepID=A0A1M5H202_9BACI|nr:NAD(P)H-binding protein [Ornithinibacillus halophilus]SHG09948.1 Nucleoside-diphosphate-sugar epimerase [Ornithinibacillus halophilus]
MGYAIVKELLNRQVSVIAFARNKQKLENLFRHEELVQIHVGDASVIIDLEVAIKGVDIIFNAINIPYQEWTEMLPLITSNIVKVSKKRSVKLAIVDNIYAYGKRREERIAEDADKIPVTKKGKIRLELEKMVKESGVPYVRAHFPDFYGPHVENSYINHMLNNVLANKTAYFVGDLSVAREYIYTPDGANAIVELAFNNKSYGDNWNIPGFGVISGGELINMIRDYTGFNKSVRSVNKRMLGLLGIFDKQMRELVEMQYLNENPIVLDGTKYQIMIGELPRTSYHQGLIETINSMSNKK